MSNETTVKCATCGNDEPTITARVPFPKAVREDLIARVGGGCWQTWLDQQLRIINEYRLNLGDPASHELLRQACYTFLKLEEAEEAQLPATGPDKARELGNISE